MQLTDFIIIFLLMSCVILWYIISKKECPLIKSMPAQVIYRYKPELDLQFDSRNFPTAIYDDVFNGTNVAQGGYQLLNTGRITASDDKNASEFKSKIPIRQG